MSSSSTSLHVINQFTKSIVHWLQTDCHLSPTNEYYHWIQLYFESLNIYSINDLLLHIAKKDALDQLADKEFEWALNYNGNQSLNILADRKQIKNALKQLQDNSQAVHVALCRSPTVEISRLLSHIRSLCDHCIHSMYGGIKLISKYVTNGNEGVISLTDFITVQEMLDSSSSSSSSPSPRIWRKPFLIARHSGIRNNTTITSAASVNTSHSSLCSGVDGDVLNTTAARVVDLHKLVCVKCCEQFSSKKELKRHKHENTCRLVA